jgi:plasmid replication initiation protein
MQMIDENGIIEKSRNMVAMQCFSLGEQELKILDVYLSRIDPRDTSTREVTFTKREYEELLGVDRIRTENLKKYVHHLMSNIVSVKVPNGSHEYVLFPTARIMAEKRSEDDSVGQVTIKLSINYDLDPIFFNIKHLGYIKYRLKNVIALKYKYDIKLYLFLKLHEYPQQHRFTISLEELKKQIECNKKTYDKYYEFNKAVLKPAVQRINDFTDIEVEYKKPRKQSCEEEVVIFTISRKKEEKKNINVKEQVLEQPIEESVKQDNKYNIPLDVFHDEDFDLDLLEVKVRQAIPSANENKMQEIFQAVNIKYNPKKAQAPFLYYLGILKKTLLERTELGKQDKIEQAKKDDFHNFEERRDFEDLDGLVRGLNQ